MSNLRFSVLCAFLIGLPAGCKPEAPGENPNAVTGTRADLAAPRDFASAPRDFASAPVPVYDLLPQGDAGDPPPIACGMNGACELPHSVCADGNNLAYYSNPRCVDGYCRFDKHFMSCPYSCAEDGCRVAITSREQTASCPGT